ncbi:PadR family transcriptional regulator [Amycolatopsis sp. cmx-8-4]|uniref:PadR family transcriptional regulator n=1 Tax=Amycolatopsis sp. cmx-8-4 TaxID=2790947 RepID=UPI00397D5C5D
MSSPRMTLPTQLVLRALLEEPTREMYGLEVCRAAGLPSGTIHPILTRLEKAGWLQSRWEKVDPVERGRPRRKYYCLDPNRVGAVLAALQRSDASAQALARLRPSLAGEAG